MDSYWAEWGEWGGCSATCGEEGVNITKTKVKSCNEPRNSGSWVDCAQGQEEVETGTCTPIPCPLGKYNAVN